MLSGEDHVLFCISLCLKKVEQYSIFLFTADSDCLLPLSFDTHVKYALLSFLYAAFLCLPRR